MKSLLLLLVIPVAALATQTETYGWEGSNTVVGVYGNGHPDLEYSSPVYMGTQSLEFWESPYSGTPQAFVCWVKYLNEGDTVAASFWVYDTTPGTNPSGRIWGHWTDDPTDPTSYSGSASGNNTYSAGTGWSQLSWEWTVDADTTHTGLMVEARLYSGAEFDTIWIDELVVEAPDGAEIVMPNIPVALQRSTWADIKSAF